MLSLQQKLSTIIQYSSDNSKDKNSNNSYKEQIKIQLANLNQYISQQFLKLSAYYETKLEYQSADYQQQIGMLKQQIQRQYKVIELMKNELQDLVVMVNLQRANERDANGISQQGMKNKCIGEIDDEHKQWRVKRGQGHRMYQNDDNTNNNSNIVYNNNLNTINSSQSHKASIQYQNQIASTIPQRNNTIFGLQIIAEQQTQRTLMSVCDQEQQQSMNENLQQRQNVQSERKRQKQVYEQIDQTRQIERCGDNSHQSISNDFIGQQQRKGVEGSNFQQDQQMQSSVKKSPIVFQKKKTIVFQKKQKKTNNTKSSQQHNINLVSTNKYFSQQQQPNKILFSNSQQKFIIKSKSKDVAVQFTNGDIDCVDDYCSKEDKESQLQRIYLVQNQCKQLNQQKVRQNTRKHNNGRQYLLQQYPQLLFNEQKMIQSIKTNNNLNKQHKTIQKKQYNNLHFQSIKPSIYYKDQQQTNQMQNNSNLNIKIQNNNNLIVKNTNKNKNTITSQNIHTQKFVSNPFSKNKSSTKLKSQNHQQAQQKQQIILYKEQQRRQLSPKLFLEQFRKSFAEQRNSLQRPQQVRRSTQTRQDVMSLLQMIAMKGSAQNSKRSQRKCSSTNRDSNSNNNSRSRRKLQQQLAPSSVKNTNERKKRILTEQSSSGLRFTEQQQLSQYKQKQLLSYQKYRRSRINSKNLKGRFQTQILTHGQQQCQQPFYLNVLGKQISNLSEYQQQLQSNNYFSGEDHNFQNRNDSFEKQIFNNNNNNYYEQFRSLQTTFGRPVSFQCLRQIKNNTNTNDIDNSCNEDGKLNHSQIQRKFSAGGIQINKNQPNKLIKYPNNQKFFKNNKENQPQRRMSEKITTSKNKPIKNSTSSFLEKKPSTKFIKNKQNINFTQQQIQQKNSSIASMLQSHLQNSNKFLVGSKKQQIKYDGQRITYGHMTLKHGHGILYYSNGLIYEGEFVQNKRHGYGLLKFNHVELYSGEWGNDQLNGKGKIRNCAIINKKKKQAGEGNTGNGQWSNVNNIFTKWISYCGQFKQNRFEGQGTLYLQGGQKFVGWFRNGVADGQGSLFKKNGQVQSGRWKNNILIEKYEMQWY